MRDDEAVALGNVVTQSCFSANIQRRGVQGHFVVDEGSRRPMLRPAWWSIDLQLMSAGKTPEHLGYFASFSLVDIIFLTMLIDIINGFDARARLMVLKVFGHGLNLPPKNVKTRSDVPRKTTLPNDFFSGQVALTNSMEHRSWISV
jgi:hypothetical protein